ncbi:MAG TPA: hypothetical protein VLV45_07855 [Gemmatimonadales bacterium]|jgi:hypothetical protein|nr:hypothetical protein [Gemmatimonadales bacterium]
MTRSLAQRMLIATVLATLVACGGQPKPAAVGTTDSMTERQRDSMLAGSRIPGASGVGAAMRAADATSHGIRSADSVAP